MPPPPEVDRPRAGVSTSSVVRAAAPGTPPASSPYRPWSTLLPRAWLPVIETGDHETRAGVAVGGADALGYHAWAATTTWSLNRDADVAPVSPGARPDLLLAYAYDRWRPTFFAQYTDETSPLLIPSSDGQRRPIALRERSVDVGATVPFRRVRWSQSAIAFWRREHDGVSGPLRRRRFRSRCLASRMGREHGTTVRAPDQPGRWHHCGRLRRDRPPWSRRGWQRTVLPGGHACVPALRAETRRAGAPRFRRGVSRRRARAPHTSPGGHDGDGSVLSFDEDASSLLRGFPADAFFGTHVLLGNAEYRLPLAYIERGVGTWPIFLRAFHLSGFVDAGQAWTNRLRASEIKLSLGRRGRRRRDCRVRRAAHLGCGRRMGAGSVGRFSR